MAHRPHRLSSLAAFVLALTGCRSPTASESRPDASLAIEYLEVVTTDVEATCEALALAHGVTFGAPVAELGAARTAALAGGGRIGVRAPMAAHEGPVVRPYVLVEDLAEAVAAAESGGAEVALRSMEIPGQGTIAIYVLAGIEHGLWERLPGH